MLEFDNVSMRYQEVGDVLRNVSFRLTKGEIAFLTGHSGAGKSTLFKLIAMIERGNRGKIMFNKKDDLTKQFGSDFFLKNIKVGLKSTKKN